MTTIKDWLAILLPGYEVQEGAISALSSQCEKVYQLNADEIDGYEKTYLQALYILAHQGTAIDGVNGIRAASSRREGKVSTSYATGKNGTVKAGWKGTTFGIEFLDIVGAGGGALLGSAS